MQAAFAAYAGTHQAASIRRCRSNWNTLCDFLYTGDIKAANPMSFVGRLKVARTLPKGLGAETISELLTVIDDDRGSERRSDWAERDRAIVLTAVLAGLRADELVRADAGDIRATDRAVIVHVHGKGNKDRRIPVEQPLIHELEAYLDSRAARFPGSTQRRPTAGDWPRGRPLRHCWSAVTAPALPAARCGTGCYVPSRTPGWTPGAREEICCMASGVVSPRSSPTRIPACMR
ncbi:Tyrosine recombinase XerD [Mycobacterium persicum]|uniref:Tyrosine recombinase XerD n=1 Tax=Mycobacterium persicum TaxID=1487726 RepID=A0AB38UVX9_9MYCO|nr:Tyrosine recombinase XerD [Mycobacterium persicum]